MEAEDAGRILREIPPVNDLMQSNPVLECLEKFGKDFIIEELRQIIEEFREIIRKAGAKSDGTGNITAAVILTGAESILETDFSQAGPEELRTDWNREKITEYLARKLQRRMEERTGSGLRKVINATGIVLHTNLGRSPLPELALEWIRVAGEGYSNLEFDLDTGERGSRHAHIEPLIARITGAESAIVVNNNAAAVFLCLNTVASGKEVIVSRGQQVEIGGSFRIPDIITRSGAAMVEVGTTNKTRLTDYSNAITPDTAVLLKVHTSNYKVTGFTEEVGLGELTALGKSKGITVMEDLGSGSLFNLSTIGLPYEPTVQDSIRNGADLVTFSGDKLLGGPQAGIIAGSKEWIDKIKRNPLLRMVRCDKTTIAALAAVLNLYLDPVKAVGKIPVLRMMARKEEELEADALELADLIKSALSGSCITEVVRDLDEIGGGSLPGVMLCGRSVALSGMRQGVNPVQSLLRKAKIPVVCRIQKDKLLLNVRTIDKKDYPVVVDALISVMGTSV